jgi:hypothetical protein
MKWLWLGFGLVWGLSLWLDARRRRQATGPAWDRLDEPVDQVDADLAQPVREAA